MVPGYCCFYVYCVNVQFHTKKIKLYKGFCETAFKKRYASHKKSFNVPTYKTVSNFLPNIGPLKQSSLNQICHGKLQGGTIPTMSFPRCKM